MAQVFKTAATSVFQTAGDQTRKQINFQNAVGGAMRNIVLKVLYEIFMNISYFVLALSIGFSIMDSSRFVENWKSFLLHPLNYFYMIILIPCAITIYTLSKMHHPSNQHLKAQDKKNINFVADIMKAVTYIIYACFIKSFVNTFPDQNYQVAYFFLMLGLFTYLIRVAVQWYYFKVDKDGKLEVKFWESPIQSQSNLYTILADSLKDQIKKVVVDINTHIDSKNSSEPAQVKKVQVQKKEKK